MPEGVALHEGELHCPYTYTPHADISVDTLIHLYKQQY